MDMLFVIFIYTLIDFLKNKSKTFSYLVLKVLRLSSSIAASCAYYNIVMMIDSFCYSFLLFFLSLSLYSLCSHLGTHAVIATDTTFAHELHPLFIDLFLLYSLPFLSQHDVDLVSRENKQVIIFFLQSFYSLLLQK